MLNYIKTKRAVKIKGEKTDIFYPTIFRQGVVSQEDLAERISQGSTIAKGEINGILTLLTEAITKEMQNSSKVKLEIGTFAPKFKSKAIKNLDEVTADVIQGINVKFTPDGDLKKIIERTGVQFIDLDKVNHV